MSTATDASSAWDPSTGSRKLNLGCGFDRRPNYLNVDLQGFHGPDLVANILDLSMLPSLSFEEIIAQDVIEHFRWADTPRALLEWNRLLVPGGRMFLSTTYLPGLLTRMQLPHVDTVPEHKQLIVNLFSAQAYEGDFHLTAFTERLMRYYVWAAGFEIEEITVRDGWLFHLWARKAVDHSLQDLIEADTGEDVFIRALYPRVLERAPGEAEVAEVLATASGRSRLDLARSFLLSDEREGTMIARAPDFDLAFDIQPWQQSLAPSGEHVPPNGQVLTAEGVRQAYLWILGREPESPDVVQAKLRQCAEVSELRRELLASEEFRQTPAPTR